MIAVAQQLTARPGKKLPPVINPSSFISLTDTNSNDKDVWAYYKVPSESMALVAGREILTGIQVPDYSCDSNRGFYLNKGGINKTNYPVYMLPVPTKQSTHTLNPGGLTSERATSAANAIVPSLNRASLRRTLLRG